MRLQSKVITPVIVLAMFLTTSCADVETLPKPTYTSAPTKIDSLLKPTNLLVPTVVEPGLAYGIPCRPPCWRGLVPGQSTRQQAAQVIGELRTEGWADHIIDGGSFGGGYSISPSPFTSHGTIHVIIKDDTVTEIHGTTLLFYYPMGTLIQQFGDPEGLYIVSQGSTGCSSCEEWEPPDVPVMNSPVHLLYPSQGLWFLALVPFGGLGCICPEMKVVTFCYYAPVSMQEAMKNNYLADLCTDVLNEVTEKDLIEWHGFGGGY